MSYSALRWGFVELVDTPYERLVLLVLCNAHLPDRTISLTIKQLAERTGLHPDTIRKALKGLEEKGLILRYQEPGFPTEFELIGYEKCGFPVCPPLSETVQTGMKWS